ncbi:hypothetical protein ACFL6H_06325 [Candidatus Latescibacterota bacterium]
MREFQKCQKCGKLYCQIDQTGPSIGGFGDIMLQSDETVCTSCGGTVIWVDEGGSPLSAYKRFEEANSHLRLGCLYGISALIFFLILYFLVLK